MVVFLLLPILFLPPITKNTKIVKEESSFDDYTIKGEHKPAQEIALRHDPIIHNVQNFLSPLNDERASSSMDELEKSGNSSTMEGKQGLESNFFNKGKDKYSNIFLASVVIFSFISSSFFLAKLILLKTHQYR